MNPKLRASNTDSADRPHFSAEQAEAMLRPSAFRTQAAKHLESCSPCREEVETLSALLGRFRATSVVYAEQEQARSGLTRKPVTARSMFLTRPQWALAGCTLAFALLAAVPMHRLARPNTPASTSASPAAVAEISDEALLEGVQHDLSASLPAPLQLLSPADESSSAVTHTKARH